MGKPKSAVLTVYLIEGQPNDLRSIFIANKTCQAFVVPREKISLVKEYKELKTSSLYILLSVDSGQIYIGQTDNFIDRLNTHSSGKEWWDIAVTFFAKDDSLTKTECQYLEYLALNHSVNKVCDNKNSPKKPNLPRYLQSIIEDFFDDIKLITVFLGYELFNKKDNINTNNKELLYLTNKGVEAKGIFKDGTFTLFKGSVISEKNMNKSDIYNKEQLL